MLLLLLLVVCSDGHAANRDDIYLTDGASPGIQRLLTMLIRDSNDGVRRLSFFPLLCLCVAVSLA